MTTPLRPEPFDSASFNYTDHTLVAEASTIGFNGAHKLFAKSDTMGITVRSHRTRRVEPFRLVRTVKDPEGEVQGWEFEAMRRELGVKVLIFND